MPVNAAGRQPSTLLVNRENNGLLPSVQATHSMPLGSARTVEPGFVGQQIFRRRLRLDDSLFSPSSYRAVAPLRTGTPSSSALCFATTLSTGCFVSSSGLVAMWEAATKPSASCQTTMYAPGRPLPSWMVAGASLQCKLKLHSTIADAVVHV